MGRTTFTILGPHLLTATGEPALGLFPTVVALVTAMGPVFTSFCCCCCRARSLSADNCRSKIKCRKSTGTERANSARAFAALPIVT